MSAHYNVSANGAMNPQIRVRSRGPSTPLNQMLREVRLVSSDASQQDFTCTDDRPEPGSTECRWGDYAGASPDPAAEQLVWGTNAYVGPADGTSAHWRTRNFAIRP
jgi:hypothetical protein